MILMIFLDEHQNSFFGGGCFEHDGEHVVLFCLKHQEWKEGIGYTMPGNLYPPGIKCKECDFMGYVVANNFVIRPLGVGDGYF